MKLNLKTIILIAVAIYIIKPDFYTKILGGSAKPSGGTSHINQPNR